MGVFREWIRKSDPNKNSKKNVFSFSFFVLCLSLYVVVCFGLWGEFQMGLVLENLTVLDFQELVLN